ncbi:hypothetical protein CRYUN_Cryun18bG0121300 [Craigia yunnanensis]
MRFGIDVKEGNISPNLEPTPSTNSVSTCAFERLSLRLSFCIWNSTQSVLLIENFYLGTIFIFFIS